MSGHCDATLNGARNNFSFTCTHNVPGATIAHFHLLDNTIICQNQSPAATFSNSCPVTAGQAQQIEQAGSLIDVHNGPGLGSDQVIAGVVN